MSWNHRVIKTIDAKGFQIHEVYYDEEGKIDGWTIEGVTPYSDDSVNLRSELHRMLIAFTKEILEEVVINGKIVLKICEER